MTAAAQGARERPRRSIRTIWGLAKSPELQLDDANLYAVVERETGKDSLRTLTQGEIDRVCRVLSNMKDDVNREIPRRRTDEGGDPRTVKQRRRIYVLTGELGWNDNPARIRGLAKRMFGIEPLDWLTPAQCNKLIEALKKMADREQTKEAPDGSSR